MKLLLLTTLLFLSCCLNRAQHTSSSDCDNCCQDDADFVTSLPGFNQPLPSPWHSGYLTYQLEGRTVHTHYVLVQAEEPLHDADSRNNNKKKQQQPLLYWSNGGPGASSLFGLLTELGPLQLSDLSLETDLYRKTGIATPLYNPYTWTRLGHVLVIDQPAPVGFSYCGNNDNKNDTKSHSCGGIAWTDELASQNAYLALKAFYNKFPCYGKTNLYLTGESYGGIYIPTLARRILQGDNRSMIKKALKGFAVGDGCLGTQTGICGSLAGGVDGHFGNKLWPVLFMAGHGQIPLKTYREVIRACRPEQEHHQYLLRNNINNPACQAALQKSKEQAGGFYEYSLYDDCTYRNGLSSLSLKGAVNDYPCGGGPVMESYLRLQEVKKALHVENAYFFSTDNAEGDFDYTPTEKDLTSFYKEINGKLRVLIYNGDADPAITSFAAQNWTSHLGFAETESWRPWTIDGCRRMGGYVTRYEGDFDFVTIRGAGHMVPTYKAEATFAFLKAWIEGTDYLAFDKECEKPQGLSNENEITLKATE